MEMPIYECANGENASSKQMGPYKFTSKKPEKNPFP